MSRMLDVFAEADLLVDDRTPAVEARFACQTDGLPEPMVEQLCHWFQIMLNGSPTPPRRRPRSQITARVHLGAALPALQHRTAAGGRSLREISVEDVKAAPPASGHRRAVAALIALAAFHGLRSRQLRQLILTDIRDGRLHLDGRVVLLADAVRARLAAYLDYRTRRWPNSSNPHLFLTQRTAGGPGPVGARWIKPKIAITGAAQAIREDRILDEAHATGGDIRAICAMFGLSVTAAERYTATVDHPDLVDCQP